MEAIYQALLLIPQSPSRATKILNNLSCQNPSFLPMLKDMALQLKQRFKPHNAQTYAQYQNISKHILVIFNRYTMLAFQKKDNKVYLHIEEHYQWTMDLLICPQIPLTTKKVLEPSLKEIISAICFKKDAFLNFLDRLTSDHLEATSSIFLYLNCLLQSSVNDSEKIASLQHSYQTLYYLSLRELSKMVQYYKNTYMEEDYGSTSNKFTTILKENEYILKTMCDFISYIHNLFTKEGIRHGSQELFGSILLHSDLALYLSRVIKIENQMFERAREDNPFGLKVIIASNMNSKEKRIINKIKCMCFNIIRLILSITEKDFNLIHTDKILLKELFSIKDLVVSELIICSHQNVISSLGEELSIIGIISSLFDVLSEIVLFRDIKSSLQKLTIEQIIRLTLAFMRTFSEEQEIFENEVQEYFVLMYYILYGRVDTTDEDQTIDLTLGEICMKKNIVKLIQNMNSTIQGFNSILLEVCCDSILLQMKLRQTKKNEFKEMFSSKYDLKQGSVDCIKLQAAVFTFAVVLQKASPQDKKTKFRFFLQTVNLSLMSELEISRVFICLSVHCREFFDHDIHTKYYKFVQVALKTSKKLDSVSRHAFYFLQRLTVTLKNFQNKQYLIFLDKVFNDALEHLTESSDVNIIEFLNHSIQKKQIQENIMNLPWINDCLKRLNRCVWHEYGKKNIRHQYLTSVFILYDSLLKSALKLIQDYQQSPYSSLRRQIDDFNDLFNQMLTERVFDYFHSMLKDNDLILQEYFLLYRFGDLLFDLLIHDIILTEHSSSCLTTLTIAMLSRPQELNIDYKNMTFKLLYQVINKTPFTLHNSHYQVILSWMKQDIDNEVIDQIFLNRVCIILQEFYFFIHNNPLNKQQIIEFFEPVTLAIEQKFLKYLLDFHQTMEIVGQEMEQDVRNFNLKNIYYNPKIKQKKKYYVTIIRLYNTILMNPNFRPKSLHLIKDHIKYYINETIPSYDLSVHFLALGTIIKKSKNSGAIQCFRLGLDLLYYNAVHPEVRRQQTQMQKQIRNLTKDIRSPIAALDPYKELSNLLNEEIVKTKQSTIFIDFHQNFQDLEVDVVEFIKSDPYVKGLVQKLTSIRKVNDQPRIILKVKKSVE